MLFPHFVFWDIKIQCKDLWFENRYLEVFCSVHYFNKKQYFSGLITLGWMHQSMTEAGDIESTTPNSDQTIFPKQDIYNGKPKIFFLTKRNIAVWGEFRYTYGNNQLSWRISVIEISLWTRLEKQDFLECSRLGYSTTTEAALRKFTFLWKAIYFKNLKKWTF